MPCPITPPRLPPCRSTKSCAPWNSPRSRIGREFGFSPDRLWALGERVREQNTKSQTPNSREFPNFEFQNLSQARCFGAWDLELLWCLVFGVWSFNWRSLGFVVY